MALHARLVAPPPEPRHEWPWHQAKWSAVPCNVLWQGDRRMEAETYLSSGYGLRVAIEGRPGGWKRFDKLARTWQPSRLKGIQVSPEFGTPFLAATQVFDIRPVPRKWLALERTDDAAQRFVQPGKILVTCSGVVGRATLSHAPHENTLITHDLLRVEPFDDEMWGWVYAYLRSPQARAVMIGAHYGHIIKHLETTHLDALPIPVVRSQIAAGFKRTLEKILDLRNRGYQLALEAEARFERPFSPLQVKDWGESGFSVRASDAFFEGRRRFEAASHNPGVAVIRRHLTKKSEGFVTLRDAGYKIWLPGRFKRIPAEDGIELVESSSVFECNPDFEKRIAEGDFGDDYQGRVKAGWLLMARSGQIYGLNGNVGFATVAYEGKVVSDDLIRIAPSTDCALKAGYLFVALSHPLFGRPLVKSLAYGSSIPHIDVADLLTFEVVRLPHSEEEAIADLAEESAAKRAQADVLERELAADAGKLIDRFLAGDMREFNS